MRDFDLDKFLPVIQATSAWLGGVLALVILKRSIRYSIGRRFLVFKVLWVVPVRWISLANIRYAGFGLPFWSERWGNRLFRRTDAILHLRKRRGLLFRNVLITPEKRVQFKAELEQAQHAMNAQGARSRSRPTTAPIPARRATASGTTAPASVEAALTMATEDSSGSPGAVGALAKTSSSVPGSTPD